MKFVKHTKRKPVIRKTLTNFYDVRGDERIPEVVADMQKEMNGKIYPDLLERMAQFGLTLLDWAEEHKDARKYVAFADKCWPAFPEQFDFEQCYVNSCLARLLSTVCSVTAMAICAPTLLRARFCLLLPVPFCGFVPQG